MVNYRFEQFDRFSDEARVWIYGLDRSPSGSERRFILHQLDDFTQNWESHGKSVFGVATLLEERFIIFCAEDTASGCSIDSSVAVLKRINNETGINPLDISRIYYKQENGIHCLPRAQFADLVRNGVISGDTIVFDLAVEHLSGLRDGRFELEFRNSWHARAFKMPGVQSQDSFPASLK